MKKSFQLFLMTCMAGICISMTFPESENVILKKDKYRSLSGSSIQIEGIIGQKIEQCIVNGIMHKSFDLYAVPFRDKLDDGGGFSGEFWGKWMTSAVLGYSFHPCKSYRSILDKSVKDLLASQDSDGRISSYSRRNDFGFWDIWGRKYVLLGLISYYDQTGNPEALQAACRATDALMKIAGPGKTRLTETGLQILQGLPSCSVLEPIVLVYQRTGDKKYLDFANYLVKLWSEPNKYNSKGIQLIENALSGKDPIRIASPKGYEMMSCFEGLCELYRVNGDRKLLQAVIQFATSVLKKEIMIVGSGSNLELWCDGANRQTEVLEQPMETCVTVTWMKLCYQLLRLTGEQIWADQLEISLYNALMGAMMEQGKWWAYFSPLIGERVPSPLQVAVCKSSCCVANGPRGMLITPFWSVMKAKNKMIINLYSPGKWECNLENGVSVKLEQQTNYPVTDEVLLIPETNIEASFTISLRIPEWSLHTKLSVNNQDIKCENGKYAQIKRTWKKGDTIRLKLDLRGRIIQSPGSKNQLAVMRGPVVLALDNRFIKKENYSLWLLPSGTQWDNKDELGGLKYVLPTSCTSFSSAPQYIDLLPVSSKPANIWMAFNIPFLYRNTHFFKHREVKLTMCDYASAGNNYHESNLFRVWIPQPLFINDLFPEHTWKLLYQDHSLRPEVPLN